MMLHATTNATRYFLSRSHHAIFALILVVTILFVIMDKMWWKLPS